jgi:DNA-nicking Smr family endonuclease
MTRRLSEDEHALWERLRQTVKPLKHSRKATRETTAPRAPSAAREKPPPKAERARTAPPADKAKAPPLLAPFEEKTLRRLGRGLIEIDARIDLHGMRQERAHAALASFLRRQQASGARIVLIVTGKGRVGSEGRGVLRESVPRWLAGGEFRHLVVGYEEANRRHGGGGALYVRIRRRREAAPSTPGD